MIEGYDEKARKREHRVDFALFVVGVLSLLLTFALLSGCAPQNEPEEQRTSIINDDPVVSVLLPIQVSGQAILTWTPPVYNTDGTLVTDLAAYRLYWEGQETGEVYIDNPSVTEYTVENLSPGNYTFYITAINEPGVESAPSNPAYKYVAF